MIFCCIEAGWIPLLVPLLLFAETAGHVGERDDEGRAQPRREVPVRPDAHQDTIQRQEPGGSVTPARCVFTSLLVSWLTILSYTKLYY